MREYKNFGHSIDDPTGARYKPFRFALNRAIGADGIFRRQADGGFSSLMSEIKHPPFCQPIPNL
jgi:hypothetical protein